MATKFQHLKGISNYRLCLGTNNAKLEGYTYANMAGDVNIKNSTTVYLYTFADVTLFWVSILQKVVSLSIIEEAYITIIEYCKEVLWMQCFLEELGIKQDKYVLHCDS